MLNYSKILSVCVCFIVAGVLFFFVMPKESARADSPYRNTQSWSGLGPNGTPITITFSTPGGPSGSQNYFSCISASDVITTSGVPSTWSLTGQVKIYYFGYVVIPQGTYDVNQTGDLNLTVYYPPANAWPGGTNTRVLIVDLSIYVKDDKGNFVTWVNNGGTLGPGQNWNVSCPNPSAPAINITKYTNGLDANDPNGSGVPRVPPNNPVTWTYTVTNTGSVPVAERYLYVTDNQLNKQILSYQVISGNGDKILDPGEIWQYSEAGTALDLSKPQSVTTVSNSCTANKTLPPSTAYVNTGTVTPEGGPSRSDVSSYCNPPPTNVPAISVVKSVSVDNQATWYDANTAPGPTAYVNTNVFFQFLVTNVGTFPLSPITLTDDTYPNSTNGCVIPPSLASGSSFSCIIGPFPAQLGQHKNTATATGSNSGTIVSDQDVANYFGKKYYYFLPLILK